MRTKQNKSSPPRKKRPSRLNAIAQAEADHVRSELAHLLDNGIGHGSAGLRLVHVQVLRVEDSRGGQTVHRVKLYLSVRCDVISRAPH